MSVSGALFLLAVHFCASVVGSASSVERQVRGAGSLSSLIVLFHRSFGEKRGSAVEEKFSDAKLPDSVRS
jgi:hypothetical protein